MGVLSTLAQSGYYYSDPYYYSSYDSSSSVDPMVAVVLGLVFGLFGIALYVVMALCLMRIFKKAGVKQWIAWVPFYNNWKLLEIGGQQGFWAVLAILPIVNIVSAVFMYISMYNIGLKLGKEGVFILLAIFVSPVWFIWLAVDGSTWDESKGAPSLAPEVANAPKPAAPTA